MQSQMATCTAQFLFVCLLFVSFPASAARFGEIDVKGVNETPLTQLQRVYFFPARRSHLV